jgi:hypothetical protein
MIINQSVLSLEEGEGHPANNHINNATNNNMIIF